MKNLIVLLLILSFIISCASSTAFFLKKEDLPPEVKWYEEKDQFVISIDACYGKKLMPNMKDNDKYPAVGDSRTRRDGSIGHYDSSYYGDVVSVLGTITNDNVKLYVVKAKDKGYLFLKQEDLPAINSLMQVMKEESDKFEVERQQHERQFQQREELISSIIESYVKAASEKSVMMLFKNSLASNNPKIMNRGYESWIFTNDLLTLFEAKYAFVITFKSKKLAALYDRLSRKAGDKGTQLFAKMLEQSMAVIESTEKKVYETKIGLLRAVPTHKVKYLFISLDGIRYENENQWIVFTAEN